MILHGGPGYCLQFRNIVCCQLFPLFDPCGHFDIMMKLPFFLRERQVEYKIRDMIFELKNYVFKVNLLI